MPVDFDGSADFIQFADNAIYDGLTTKSIFIRTVSDGDGSDGNDRILSKISSGDANGWSFGRNDSSEGRPNRLFFFQTSTGSNGGIWESDNGEFNANTEYSIGVSMDIGNINNIPVFYIDGLPLGALDERIAPTGAFHTTDTEGLRVGQIGGFSFYNGKVHEICIADVIWTADEFADMHKTPNGHRQQRGVIFYVLMNSASGLQVFDGSAITSSNKIVDLVNGIIGTATSSPLGVADTIVAV